MKQRQEQFHKMDDAIGEWLDCWVVFPSRQARNLAIHFVRNTYLEERQAPLVISGPLFSGKSRLLYAMQAIACSNGLHPPVFIDEAELARDIPIEAPHLALVAYENPPLDCGFWCIEMEPSYRGVCVLPATFRTQARQVRQALQRLAVEA